MKKIAFSSLLLLFLAFSILVTGCGRNNAEEQVDADFLKGVKRLNYSKIAIQNGDIVKERGKYHNIEKWQTFLENLEINKPYEVRITKFTIEGDPIYYELTYDGNTIRYRLDC